MSQEQPFNPEPLDPRARLAAIVESSDDAIVSKTLVGVITSWNNGAQRIFGYAAEEVVGKSIAIIFPPDRLQEEPKILARIQQGERVDHFETIRVTKDGRLIEVSVTISPVRDATGRIVGASKIARDITAQKQTERELRLARDAAERARREAESARQAAESANRAKDYFLSVLSHELRTPLTPVLAAVSLIEATPNLSPEEVATHIKMIRRNVETEARLVDDLLDVTRISQGKVQLQFERIDMHQAIRSVVAMLQHATDSKQLELTQSLRAQAPVVSADAGRLQQVLLNLLSNAVKFTPAGGSITIRTRDDANSPGWLRVEIADTGIGIDGQTLPRLFRPFEQGEQTVTRQFGGLGLGLAIARSLVEMHGGRICAASDGPGHGATFSLRLQSAPTEVPPARSDAPGSLDLSPAAPLLGCRVLLVEDHEDTQRVLVRLLSSFGCQVSAAASVHEAVELSHDRDFDLLVSDLGLPDGSGLEVMEQIRKRHRIAGIALSGFGQDEDLRRSREVGFEHHLTKPVNLQTLREVILRVRR